MDVVRKFRKNNGSIRQIIQYTSFANINEKRFGKFLFTKINLGKKLRKTGHLTFENLI